MLLKQKQALLEICDISGWTRPIALTLNIKQSIRTPLNTYKLVDKTYCEKQFCNYMRTLNRHAYKSAYTRNGKRLRVIPVIERSDSDRFHFHIALEPPAHVDPADFVNDAINIWLGTEAGYGHGVFKLDADNGWIDYILKQKTKNGFEHYTDCLILSALFR